MPDQPFIVNDRRKFTADGDLRPDAPPSEPKPARPHEEESSARLVDTDQARAKAAAAQGKGPQAVPPAASHGDPAQPEAGAATGQPEEMPPLTEEQIGQSTRAYDATVDRLDTAIRAANPGMEQMPPMTFDRFVQSVYMQAIFQLGGAAEQGQEPQLDILGARQSIDMLGIIADKTKGNLTEQESRLLESALFEMRMAFLEVTQALARQAAAKQGPPPPPSGASGPSIVR